MTENTLNPGDLVSLKSGGPTMTYGGEALYGDALCYWFEGNQRQCEKFPYAVIERAEKKMATTTVSTYV
jgi:uncharacterized protein YodC (DUF2158 family)